MRSRFWPLLMCVAILLTFSGLVCLMYVRPQCVFYVVSFAAIVVVPVMCARAICGARIRGLRVGLAVALGIVWGILTFTNMGRRWTCDHGPFQNKPCQTVESSTPKR